MLNLVKTFCLFVFFFFLNIFLKHVMTPKKEKRCLKA